MHSVVFFIDELAQSKDPLVENVLLVSLLEGIAVDARVARTISRNLSPHSRSLLHEVESKIYGRAPSGEEQRDRDE